MDHNKRGAMIGTWTRMADNSNDDTLLRESVQEKIMEFQTLQYPKKYIAKTLKYMHKKTKQKVWSLAPTLIATKNGRDDRDRLTYVLIPKGPNAFSCVHT